MTLERLFVPDESPIGWMNLRAHEGAFALVPIPRGEDRPVPSAYVSFDGVRFERARFDVSALGPLDEPLVLDVTGDREGVAATGDGRMLFVHNYRTVFSARIAPTIALEATRFTEPAPMTFRRKALTVTADGTWWAGGHLNADSAKGMLYRSEDGGATWTRFAEKLPGSVGVLRATPQGLVALAFQSALAVRADGVEPLAKYRDEVWNFFSTDAGLFGFGEHFAGFAAAPGKRQKYAALPQGEGGRVHVASVTGGFVMGRLGGLWTSRDAMQWEPVAGWNDHLSPGRTRRDVHAIAPCGEGALVMSSEGEIFRVRVV